MPKPRDNSEPSNSFGACPEWRRSGEGWRDTLPGTVMARPAMPRGLGHAEAAPPFMAAHAGLNMLRKTRNRRRRKGRKSIAGGNARGKRWAEEVDTERINGCQTARRKCHSTPQGRRCARGAFGGLSPVTSMKPVRGYEPKPLSFFLQPLKPRAAMAAPLHDVPETKEVSCLE